jgi:hypothetical protein
MNSLLVGLSVSLFAAIIGFVAAWYWFGRNVRQRQAEQLVTDAKNEASRLADTREIAAAQRAKELQEFVVRFADLEAKFAILSQAVVPISAAFQAILIKELTHFHTPEMDALMPKLGPPSTLSATEETRLATLLVERQQDMGDLITESERDAAKMLLLVAKRASVETVYMTGKPVIFKLVTVTPLAEDREGHPLVNP